MLLCQLIPVSGLDQVFCVLENDMNNDRLVCL